jgi:hypothetical protein
MGQLKNAWQSIDTNSDIQNQGLMIQPCSNQATNLISGPAQNIEVIRPSITRESGGPNATSRSPRGVNIKGQFYAVHGRGMSLQGTTGKMDNSTLQAKGILTKIFKNQ